MIKELIIIFVELTITSVTLNTSKHTLHKTEQSEVYKILLWMLLADDEKYNTLLNYSFKRAHTDKNSEVVSKTGTI